MIDFDVQEVIGVGAYGKVVKALHKAADRLVAIKHVDKEAMERMELEEQLLNEIRIMKSLKHPNIVNLYDCFEDYRNVHLVMELSTEGSLFTKMSQNGMAEHEAVKVPIHYHSILWMSLVQSATCTSSNQ